MWQVFANGQGSVVLRTKIRRLSTGNGFTGLAFNTTGLVISTIADNEATATAYTVAASKIEAVNIFGTYSAPTATKCRFSEVDAINHKGLVEIQLANARFAVAGAKALWVSISGVGDMIEADGNIPLWVLDPYDPNVIADKLFYRDMTATKTAMGGGEPPRRSMMNAMRTSLNKRDTTTTAGSLTIMQENDTTAAFTQAITVSSGAQLITSIG